MDGSGEIRRERTGVKARERRGFEVRKGAGRAGVSLGGRGGGGVFRAVVFKGEFGSFSSVVGSRV